MRDLALIAMSGIRVAKKEVLDFGMTFPGIVERSQLIASMPSLGLLTLGALTPPSWNIRYFEVDSLDDLDGTLQLGRDSLPDLAAISTFTARIKDAYIISDRLMENGIRTVIGGLHATVCPDEAKAHCDAVVVGEGELTWESLLVDFESGDLKPIYLPDSQGFDLKESPMPAYELLEKEKYNRLTVQASRGCPWHCDFCAASILLNRRYRTKPVDRIVAEIEKIKSLWPDPFIEFADDNTFVNKGWGKELCRALIPLKIKWFTETDISVADDDELLGLLRESGCRQVLIGIESPTQEGLRGIELVRDWKLSRHNRYKENIARIQSAGITVNACFVLGLDGDGLDIFERVLEFVEETSPYDVQITVMTPFPGTPLYDRLLKQERILRPGQWEYCTLFDVNFKPDRMTVEELEEGFLWLASHIYDDEKRRHRQRAFFSQQKEADEVIRED